MIIQRRMATNHDGIIRGGVNARLLYSNVISVAVSYYRSLRLLYLIAEQQLVSVR